MHSGRILVVAPDNDLRRSLTFALAAYGYTVTAEQVWPGSAMADAFDCIVLDEHVLPKSTLSPALMSSRRPVLLLAYSEEALANDAVTGVIAMPLKGEAVMQAVEAAMSMDRQNAK
jgi:DNA-binding response OmpR family regulator